MTKATTTAILAALAIAPLSASADELDDKMNGMLYPVVRVMCGWGGGSGTIIYSDDRDEEGRFDTFVMTNHHVIDGAIRIEQKWNSLKGKYENVEERDRVQVELFVYDRGKVIATQDFDADIVAHSEDHDLAVLRLCYPREIEYVAPLLAADKSLRMFQDVYAVGCSLLHEPIATAGHVTDLEDMIDGVPYCMTTADIIFGNSGGAVFTKIAGVWYLTGVPSRVAVTHGSPITHMAWFIPPDRIRTWVAEQLLDFLVDPARTPKQCFEERAKLLSPAGGHSSKERNLSPYDYAPDGDGEINPERAIVKPKPKPKPDPSKVYGPKVPKRS